MSWTHFTWFSLFLYAWAAVLTGALLPEIILTFELNLSVAGLLVAIPAIGFIIAGIISTLTSTKLGLENFLMISAIGLSFSLFLASIAPAIFFLIFILLCIGFFGGLLETSCNGIVAHLNRNRAVRELNRLHIFYGFGAFFGPMVAAFLITKDVIWRANYVIVALILMVLFVALKLQFKISKLTVPVVSVHSMINLIYDKNLLRAWLGAFLFVSSELGLSNWLVSYLTHENELLPEVSTFGLSIFWVAMLVGRYLNTHIPISLKSRTIIVLESLGGAFALIIMLHINNMSLTFIMLICTGLCMAGLLPGLLAYANERNQGYYAATMGFIMMGVGMGMLVGPWLIGILSDLSNLNFAMNITFVLLFLLGIIFILPEKFKAVA